MASAKLRGNDLRKLGYPEGRATTLALDILDNKQFRKLDKGSALALLQKKKGVGTLRSFRLGLATTPLTTVARRENT